MRTASLVLSGLLLACAGSSLVVWRVLTGWFHAPKSANAADQTVWVRDPDPAKVAALLTTEGLVSRQDWFELYLRTFRSKERRIRPGEYNLSAKMSPAELVDTLETGDVVVYSVAFPPGSTADDVASAFSENGLVDPKEFRALLDDPRFIAELQLDAKTLEGFLFPGAYHLSRGTSVRDLAEQMVAEYRGKVGDTLIESARAHGLGETQLAVLASLIEAEPVPVRQWAEVSAVFHNRLKKRLPLKSRGSVAYALKKKTTALGAADFLSEHSHNTYRRLGLPPTPISNPGLDAFVAAARPATSDALYYAGPKPDGTWVFCPDEGCLEALLGPGALARDPSPPLLKTPEPESLAATKKKLTPPKEADPPKADAPKADAPKADAPKADPTKAKTKKKPKKKPKKKREKKE
ncbi:MAG: endolytic transglycosylase MltG [Deltaproteobacteria bacterium]|nr:endolytic transglycosylase MltG [Deltaproteobacteria bacterium]